MRKIILPQETRLFRKRGSLLCQTDQAAEKGAEIEVGPPEMVVYDHRDQFALSFRCPDLKCTEVHYILVEEAGLSKELN